MFDYLWVIPIWILSFICHEYMHCFEHMRQGGGGCKISYWNWHGLPSLHVYFSHPMRNPDMVYLAGGLYTSLIHLLILVLYCAVFGIIRNGFTFAVVGIGLIQFFYGYYEMKYLTKVDQDMYMQGHYILYFVVGVVFCIVWFLL